MVDLGPSEKTLGLAFVALTRFKNVKHFLIQPFTYSRLQKIKESKSLLPRLNGEKRLEKLIILTKERFSQFLL